MDQSGTDSEEDNDRILACPVCGEAMEAQSVRNVEVDVCEDHGMWLGRGELEIIQLRGFTKGSRKRRERVEKAREEGRSEGRTPGLLDWLF